MSENFSPVDSCESRQSVLHDNHLAKVLDLRVHTQKRHQQLFTEEEKTLQVASADPRLWKRADVISWLQWAEGYYQLDNVDTAKFAMNGRGLCLLTRTGFMSRAPSCGDVLHSDFQRRYAVAVFKSEKERKTRRGVYLQADSASKEEAKRPKVEEKQEQELRKS